MLSFVPSAFAQPAPPTRFFLINDAGLAGFESDRGVFIADLIPELNNLAAEGALVDFVVRGAQAYALYESGAIQALGEGPAIAGSVIQVGRAVDLEFLPDGEGLVVLDDSGALHVAWSARPTWLGNSAPHLENAAGFALIAGGGWLFDGAGTIKAIGAAPALIAPASGPIAARRLRVGADGAVFALDAGGAVYRFVRGAAGVRLPMARALVPAIDIILDPDSGEPLVLYANGATSRRELAAPHSLALPVRAIALLPANAPLPAHIARAPVRLAFSVPAEPAVLDASYILPITLEHARDISFLDFRITLEDESFSPIFGLRAGDLLPADVVIDVSPGEREARVSVDCGAAPEAAGIDGRGVLFNLELSPAAAGSGRLRLDELRWLSRGSAAAARDPRSATATVQILLLPPAAVLEPAAGGLARDGEGGMARGVLGSYFDVEFRVEHVKALAGVAFDLVFDASRLEIVSLTSGDFMKSAGPTAERLGRLGAMNRAGAGRELAVTLLGETPGVRGTGVVARARFRMIAAGPGHVALDNVRALAADGRPIELSMSRSRLDLEVR